jgi:hypothetical protein
MLLLLDAQFSQAVSRPLRADGIDVLTLDEWHDGAFRHASDEQIVEAAAAESRTLVTYDIHTIPDLLRERAERGRSHGGVVYVNDRTIRQGDFGGQIRALRALVEERGGEDWTDVVGHLRRG